MKRVDIELKHYRQKSQCLTHHIFVTRDQVFETNTIKIPSTIHLACTGRFSCLEILVTAFQSGYKKVIHTYPNGGIFW